MTIAIVCDGHGGERYFRSQHGARIAAEVTVEVVSAVVENGGKEFAKVVPFTAVGPSTEMTNTTEINSLDFFFRNLFSAIVFRWRERINYHAMNNVLTAWEMEHVPQKYRDQFEDYLQDLQRLDENDSRMEKIYGCTLMVYVQTPSYWFAFHIGDGKCLAFDIFGKHIWEQPIPWDDRCFLNKTTSLCDTDPIPEFRYCYEANGHFPTAVFLGSDGLDDSFGEDENLANFYIQILKSLVKDGKEATVASLQDTLPHLSKIGSKDDMSVACVYNEQDLTDFIDKFIEHQIHIAKISLSEIETRIDHLESYLETHHSPKDRKEQIDRDYALKDLDKAKAERVRLADKYNSLIAELPNTTLPTYNIAEDTVPTGGEDAPATEAATPCAAPPIEQQPSCDIPSEAVVDNTQQ